MPKLPNISETYPPFLTPDVLKRPYTLTVSGVDLMELYSERERKHIKKYVVSFKEANARLACSQAIARSVASVLGDDPNRWVGQKLVLFKDAYNNKDCIRARPVGTVDSAPTEPLEPPVDDEVDAHEKEFSGE